MQSLRITLLEVTPIAVGKAIFIFIKGGKEGRSLHIFSEKQSFKLKLFFD